MRLLRARRRRRPARRSRVEDPWEALTSTLWARRGDPRRRPRAVRGDGGDPGRRSLHGPASRAGAQRDDDRDASAARRTRARCAPDVDARRHPDAHVRRRLRDRKEHRCPDAWRRHLTIVIDGLRAERPRRDRSPPSLWGMTAPKPSADPELQQVAWDLSHLLDGAGDDPQAAVDALLGEAQARADAFAERYAGKVAELDGAGARRGDARARPRSRSSPAAPAPTRTCASRSTPPTRRAARCCSASQEKGTAIETALLFFDLEWAALDDERAEELLAADGLDFARHHLRTARRYRPHLLSEPEEKILTEKALSRPLGLGAAVRGADGGDHRRRSTTRRAGRRSSVALARLFDPTARCAATPPSASPTALAARPAHARLRRSTRCWPTR